MSSNKSPNDANDEQESLYNSMSSRMGMNFPYATNRGQQNNVGHPSMYLPSSSLSTASALHDSKESQTIDDQRRARLVTQQTSKRPLRADLDSAQLQLLSGGSLPSSLFQQGALPPELASLSGSGMAKRARTGKMAASDLLSFELHLQQQALLRQQQDEAQTLFGMHQWTSDAVLQEKIKEGRRELQKLQEEIQIRELLRVREDLLLRKQQHEEQLVAAAQQAQLQQHNFLSSFQDIEHLQALRQSALDQYAYAPPTVSGASPHLTAAASIGAFGGNKDSPNKFKNNSFRVISDAVNSVPHMQSAQLMKTNEADSINDIESIASDSKTLANRCASRSKASLLVSEHDSVDSSFDKSCSMTTAGTKSESIYASYLEKGVLINKSKSDSVNNKVSHVHAPILKNSLLQGKSISVPTISSIKTPSNNKPSQEKNNINFKNKPMKSYTSHSKNGSVGQNTTDPVSGKATNDSSVRSSVPVKNGNTSTTPHMSQTRVDHVGNKLKIESNVKKSNMKRDPPKKNNNDKKTLSFVKKGMFQTKAFESQVQKYIMAHMNPSASPSASTKKELAKIIQPSHSYVSNNETQMTSSTSSTITQDSQEQKNTTASREDLASKILTQPSMEQNDGDSIARFKNQSTTSTGRAPLKKKLVRREKAAVQAVSNKNDEKYSVENKTGNSFEQCVRYFNNGVEDDEKGAPVSKNILSIHTKTVQSKSKASIQEKLTTHANKFVASSLSVPMATPVPLSATTSSAHTSTHNSRKIKSQQDSSKKNKNNDKSTHSNTKKVKKSQPQPAKISKPSSKSKRPVTSTSLHSTDLDEPPPQRLACTHNEILFFVQDHVPELASQLFEIHQLHQKEQDSSLGNAQTSSEHVSLSVVEAVLQELYKLVEARLPTEIAESPIASSYYEQLRIRCASCIRTMEIIKKGLTLKKDTSTGENTAIVIEDDNTNIKAERIDSANMLSKSTQSKVKLTNHDANKLGRKHSNTTGTNTSEVTISDERKQSIVQGVETNNKNGFHTNDTSIIALDKSDTTFAKSIERISKRRSNAAKNMKPINSVRRDEPQAITINDSGGFLPRFSSMKLPFVNKKGIEHLKQLQEQQQTVWNLFSDSVDVTTSQQAAMKDDKFHIDKNISPDTENGKEHKEIEQDVPVSSKNPYTPTLTGPHSSLIRDIFGDSQKPNESMEASCPETAEGFVRDSNKEREKAMSAARALLNFGSFS